MDDERYETEHTGPQAWGPGSAVDPEVLAMLRAYEAMSGLSRAAANRATRWLTARLEHDRLQGDEEPF